MLFPLTTRVQQDPGSNAIAPTLQSITSTITQPHSTQAHISSLISQCFWRPLENKRMWNYTDHIIHKWCEKCLSPWHPAAHTVNKFSSGFCFLWGPYHTWKSPFPSSEQVSGGRWWPGVSGEPSSHVAGLVMGVIISKCQPCSWFPSPFCFQALHITAGPWLTVTFTVLQCPIPSHLHLIW